MRKIVLFLMIMVINAAAFSLFEDSGDEQAKKVQYMHSLKDLVVATQKTRGLTNNFMNGNVVAQLLVYGERDAMKKALGALEKQHNDKEGRVVDIQVKKQITGIRSKLKKLNRVAFKQESAATFEAYTRIIEEIMAVGSEIADKSFAQSEDLTKKAGAIMMDVILPLTENIGKARGLGSGIVARGYCKADEVLKMNGFVDEIERLSVKMTSEMKAMSARYAKAYPAGLDRRIEKINHDIKAYVVLSRNNVIGKKNITLDPNKFFDQGTAAISEVLMVFDVNEKAMLQTKKGWF